jgi:hypothetical protein
MRYTGSGNEQTIAINTSALNSAWTYNPSIDGAIESVELTGDFNREQSVKLYVAARQNGKDYLSNLNSKGILLDSSGWDTVDLSNLVAEDFSEIGGSGLLDFSANGGEITFGYGYRRGQSESSSTVDLDFYMDNISIVLRPL